MYGERDRRKRAIALPSKIMKVLAALVVLSVAAIATSAEQFTCPETVQCPCGSSGKNVTICAQRNEVDLCSRLSECQTCQNGTDVCLACPDICSTEHEQAKLSRQKRQYNYRLVYNPRRQQSSSYQVRPNQGNSYPTRPVQQGGGFCPELNSPKLGSIRCLTNDRGRTCIGRCLPGYSFENRGSEQEITLTCTDGYFTPLREFPPCKSGGHCDLIVQGSGSFNCTTGMEGSRCDVICDGRYVGRYFCYPGRRWEPRLPHCMRPKEVEVCRCEYGGNCDSNGNCVCPVGRTGRFCETIVPEKQSCIDPGFVTNGFRRHPDESDASVRQTFDEGDSVVYSCESDGYALQGSSLLTCKSDGTWSRPLPKCIRTIDKRTCSDPGFVTNGVRRYPDGSDASVRRVFDQGGSVVYGCTSDAYALQGSSLLTCKIDGMWSSTLPKCIKTTESPAVRLTFCRDPGVDPNGSRKPRSPPNRRGFPQGTQLEYSCNQGYDLEGEKSVFCLIAGEWSSGRPKCKTQYREPDVELTYCPNPGSILNGKVVFHPEITIRKLLQPEGNLDDPEFPEGGRLQYSCDSGYTLEGSESLTCQPNGRWTAERPVCRRESPDRNLVFCRDPGRDPNGNRNPRLSPNRRGFPQGTRLDYSCKLGYELNGEKSIFCLTSGKWSSGRPSCKYQEPAEEIYCRNPGRIANGIAVDYPPSDESVLPAAETSGNEFRKGSKMQYFCDNGYTMEGSASLTCVGDTIYGGWSAEPPVCVRASQRIKYCDNPGPITNGKVSHIPALNERRRPGEDPDEDSGEYVEYPAGSRLRYSCNNGYTLQGTGNITCEASGRWSEDPPSCITSDVRNMQYCINPGAVLNGRIRYYSPVVAKPRTGSTSIVSEDTPEFPEGTRLEYDCDEGYTMEGTSSVICESTGIWSYLPPKCVADCGRSVMGTTRRILHGNKTVVGEWPWVVAIAVGQNNSTRLICGGAVLNTQTVITAAHCLREANRFTLYFGKYHRRDNLDDTQVLVRTSDKILVSPDYNNASWDSDIALITFKPRIKFSERVQPICLPTAESTALNLVSGRKGYVTGWGYTEKRLGSDELLMAHMPFVPNNECLEAFRQTVPNSTLVLTQNMFCAGYPEAQKQTTCKGDSGAPLVFYDTLVERYTLEGLVSFGVDGQCGLSRHSVFTKVYRFLPWIYRNL